MRAMDQPKRRKRTQDARFHKRRRSARLQSHGDAHAKESKAVYKEDEKNQLIEHWIALIFIVQQRPRDIV